MILLSFSKGILQLASLKLVNKREDIFYCTSCSIHSSHVKNICFSNTKEMMSLQDRIEKEKSTTTSQIKLQKQQLKLYDILSKTEIIDELHQRAVKYTSTLTKKRSHGYSELRNAWNTATPCIVI